MIKHTRLALESKEEILAVRHFIKALQLKSMTAFEEIGFFIHSLKNPSAQYKLADYLEIFPQLDKEVWKNLYKKAAEQNYRPAQNKLILSEPLSSKELRNIMRFGR